MRFLVVFAFVLLLPRCGSDLRSIDVEVEIEGSLPLAVPAQKSSAVLYRVLKPAEIAGKYGVEFTELPGVEVERRKGLVFKIQRSDKWRRLLSTTPPSAASVSPGDDFFSAAIRK